MAIGIVGQVAAQIAVICRHFEQRIALHFLRDELHQFEVSHLQQLNRLHQLRSHHQRLALSQEQVGG
jgi:hypothetical protein